MKLIERCFRYKYDEEFDDLEWFSGSLGLCDEMLRELFEIPKFETTIWASLHDRPALNRYRAEVGRLAWSSAVKLTLDSGDVVDNATLDKVLSRFLGKTVYVEVQYEE